MKISISLLALVFTALLSSCGSSESPFYNSKEDMLKQVEKIEKPAASPQEWFRLNAEGFKP